MAKDKNFFSRVSDSVLSNSIWDLIKWGFEKFYKWILPLILSGGITKLIEPIFKMNTLTFVSVFAIFSVGIGTILFSVGKLSQKILIFAKRNRGAIDKKAEEDISLSVFDYPWTEHQLNIGARGFTNFLKLGLRVTNDGESKINCALRMMDVKYNGKGIVWNWNDGEEWMDAPNPIERKFVKWDEGYNETEGKIDIAPNGGIGSLLFAESNPYNMEFWFWYVDGKSNNHQNLEGSYKVFVQLEGDRENNGIKSGFRPVQYEVEFTYKRRKLENVLVRKKRT